MNQIFFSGYDAVHPEDFFFEVPRGYPCCLLVLTASPARFFVEGELRPYPAGQIILYLPHQPIQYGAAGSGYQNDWVRFGTADPAFLTFPKPAVPFPASDPEYYHSLIQLLTWESVCAPAGDAVDHLLALLVKRLYHDIQAFRYTSKERELTALRKELQNSPQLPWTLRAMAERLHISTGYLQALYKQQFGVSCMDDVITSRLRHAEELLVSTDISIDGVARACGYQNIEHFCRQFRARTGQTPLQYRKERRTNSGIKFRNVAGASTDI